MLIHKYDILGIGNAITDILVEVDYSFLKKNNLDAGSMKLVDEREIEILLIDLSISKTLSGGSVANSISTIAHLGSKCAFIGARKKDKFGKLFSEGMEKNNITLLNEENNTGNSSSLCLVLITPDGERTMCTFLGASSDLSIKDININFLKESKVIYLEGYLFDLPDAKKIFFEVVKNAKEYNYEVALSLSDPFCVDRHREDFLSLIKNKLSILFANQSEIEALYKMNNRDALIECSKHIKVAICTLGKEGAILYNEEKYHEVKAYSADVIDTTGAGDSFAAGFLYSYINQLSMQECMTVGSFCAAQAIQVIGARLEGDIKNLLIKNNILKK